MPQLRQLVIRQSTLMKEHRRPLGSPHFLLPRGNLLLVCRGLAHMLDAGWQMMAMGRSTIELLPGLAPTRWVLVRARFWACRTRLGFWLAPPFLASFCIATAAW